MIRKLSIVLSLLLLALTFNGYSQDDETAESTEESVDTASSNSALPIINASVGLMTYRGDIGALNTVGFVEYLSPTYKLGVSYEFWNWIGIGLHGQYGVLSHSERTRPRSANFQTTFFGGNLQAQILLANDVIISSKSNSKPYLLGGLSFYSFTPKGDLFDGDGNPYYYWSDGSIRNLPETQDNLEVSEEVTRDFDYETDYSEMFGIDPFTIGFEVGGGTSFKINNFLHANVEVSYTFLVTDGIDGIEAGKGQDGFVDASLGLSFNLAKFKKSRSSNPNKNEYSDVDFDALFKQDSDADGVLDLDDRCPNTPQDVEVGSEGCPKDKDKDGVPDYLDQEIESPEGAYVNEEGVHIPDSLRAASLGKDTLATLREELCAFYPSMCNNTELEVEYQILNTGSAENLELNKQEGMPIKEVVQMADENKNGKVETKEIYQLIDKFFSGETKLQMIDLHHLVDYYFEQ
jgi:hypothetical protein